MSKMRNWLITKLLKKDGLVAVPASWQEEYVRLASERVKVAGTIAKLVNHYNELLVDYYKELSAKRLTEECKKSDIKVKSTTSKEEMADLLYHEFKMTVEKN